MAFEGCACRAAWHVGVVEWLAERGVHAEVSAGASSGALVASMIAVGADSSLREAWLDVTTRYRPYELGAIKRLRWPGRMTYVLREALVSLAGDRWLADVTQPLAITVTMLNRTGISRRVLTRGDRMRLSDALMASCFIPGPYSRIPRLDGRPAVDGAWHQRVPIDTLQPLGATRMLAVTSDPQGRLIGGALRRVELPWPANTRVIWPDAPLPIGIFDFDRARTLACIELGRRSGERFARLNDAWLGG